MLNKDPWNDDINQGLRRLVNQPYLNDLVTAIQCDGFFIDNLRMLRIFWEVRAQQFILFTSEILSPNIIGKVSRHCFTCFCD
jgi:hypothetical protein